MPILMLHRSSLLDPLAAFLKPQKRRLERESFFDYQELHIHLSDFWFNGICSEGYSPLCVKNALVYPLQLHEL